MAHEGSVGGIERDWRADSEREDGVESTCSCCSRLAGRSKSRSCVGWRGENDRECGIERTGWIEESIRRSSAVTVEIRRAEEGGDIECVSRGVAKARRRPDRESAGEET